MAGLVIVLPPRVGERVKREAERLGVTVEEYIIELVEREADPRERALDYIEAASLLLGQARGELSRGDHRQAAEKIWGAVALAVKAYAAWRDGRRLTSHRELWEYKDVVARELGEWIGRVFREASSLHTCFYEGWCTRRDVETVLAEAEKLVEEIRARIEHSRRH